jgi:hypothetical protein
MMNKVHRTVSDVRKVAPPWLPARQRRCHFMRDGRSRTVDDQNIDLIIGYTSMTAFTTGTYTCTSRLISSAMMIG